MRKFKHKKLGWIAELIDNGTWYYVKERCLDILPPELVENSDDWEEVIEKDWEVISSEITISESLNSRICSVRHKPTNKVWTLGDKTQFGTIEKFEIKDDKCYVYINSIHNGYGLAGYIGLSELTESKEEVKVNVTYCTIKEINNDEQRRIQNLADDYTKLKHENEQLKKDYKKIKDILGYACQPCEKNKRKLDETIQENTELKDAILELQREANSLGLQSWMIYPHLMELINKLATK